MSFEHVLHNSATIFGETRTTPGRVIITISSSNKRAVMQVQGVQVQRPCLSRRRASSAGCPSRASKVAKQRRSAHALTILLSCTCTMHVLHQKNGLLLCFDLLQMSFFLLSLCFAQANNCLFRNRCPLLLDSTPRPVNCTTYPPSF